VLLMPADLRDWLPEDHLAWFVLASVQGMDLSAFYASYRPDGDGRAALKSDRARPVTHRTSGLARR
jgi:hypothetical protein